MPIFFFWLIGSALAVTDVEDVDNHFIFKLCSSKFVQMKIAGHVPGVSNACVASGGSIR